MYAGIDVGGTKTLATVLDDQGVIIEQIKFPTPQKYDGFLGELAAAYESFTTKDFVAGGLALPASVLDRERGIGVAFGNLPWQDVPAQADAERLLNCPVAVENDAKLAGLSEAILLKDAYRKVLYVTVSTGIGVALIADQNIDPNFGDAGGKAMLLEHHGKLTPWESFASGKAIFNTYGKPAREITDDRIWYTIARHIAQGMIELIALTEPDVIVIGGSIGTYCLQYEDYLIAALKRYELPSVKVPPVVGAQRPEEAVIYGCYELAKERYGNVR